MINKHTNIVTFDSVEHIAFTNATDSTVHGLTVSVRPSWYSLVMDAS